MNKTMLAVCALCGAGAVQAQDAGLAVSVGVRAWYTEWTTFSYITEFDPVQNKNVNRALIQVSAKDKLLLVPVLSLRYGDFVGSLSFVPATSFSFADGGSGTRREFDLNLGYTVWPGLTATLGYKKVSQRSGPFRYEPAGPVAGLNANAVLDGPLSLYGTLGLGSLKTPMSGDEFVVKFKARYRLTEVGLAYTLSTESWPRHWIFTGGYRMQVMSSKEALDTQDGRDTTQGFTFGALARF